MIFGYVITDTRKTEGGFWSPFPRFITAIQRRTRRAGNPLWDYWSVTSELDHRNSR